MARTKGAVNKQYLLPNGSYGRRGQALAAGVALTMAPPAPRITVERSDEEILTEIKEQFEVYGILLDGAIDGDVRAFTVVGAPGVGKTHLAETKLANAKLRGITKYQMISGGISAIGLYKLAYEMRAPGCVIVLDDSDGVFKDEQTIGILKALCDSGEFRTVHWVKESAALVDDNGSAIPTSYNFEGSIVFITNLDIQKEIDAGGRMAPHLDALSSRSPCIDLLIHNRRELSVWVNHVASTSGLFARHGISDEDSKVIMTYINEHRDTLRNLDLRTVGKACDMMKRAIKLAKRRNEPVNFERLANTTLLRRV